MTTSDPALAALLGDWHETTDDAAVSFAVGGEPAPAISQWSPALPADPAAAAQALQARAQRQAEVSAQLDSVFGRLDPLTAQANYALQTDQPPSFSAATDTPEGELADLLRAGAEHAHPTDQGGVTVPVSWHALRAGMEDALAVIQRQVRLAAWVETRLQNQRLARSSVTWTGSTHTVLEPLALQGWQEGFTAQTDWLFAGGRYYISLHQRNIRVAVATRATLMRSVFVSIESATKIASALMLPPPAGPLAALPVAWNFIRRLLVEAHQHETPTL